MHDTINTAAAVASQFDAEEMEDESVNVDAALGVMKNSSTNGIVLDEFSLIVVPTNDPYLADLEDNEEVDLDKFEMMETSAFCKKICRILGLTTLNSLLQYVNWLVWEVCSVN